MFERDQIVRFVGTFTLIISGQKLTTKAYRGELCRIINPGANHTRIIISFYKNRGYGFMLYARMCDLRRF